MSLHPHVDVLFYVEDPGAANFTLGLPSLLREHGRTVHMATSGFATSYLRERGLNSEPLLGAYDVEALVTRIAPQLVVVGTSENLATAGLDFVEIATARGIPSVGLVDSSTNLSYRFRGTGDDPLGKCPQVVIVPDTVSREGMIALGLNADRIVVTGHPHWDYVRAEARSLQQQERNGLRRKLFGDSIGDRLVVVFAAEIFGGVDQQQFKSSLEYTLKGNGDSSERSEIIIQEFLQAIAPKRRNAHLVLRLHPKNVPADLSSYYSSFDTISKAGPSLEVLYACDAVVGMTSMIMIEAALMGRPTLAILPRAIERQWLPTAAAGITPYATTRLAATQMIGSLLNDMLPPDTKALDQLFPHGALQRAVAALEAVLRHKGR